MRSARPSSTTRDVMPGVAAMLPILQVEAYFPTAPAGHRAPADPAGEGAAPTRSSPARSSPATANRARCRPAARTLTVVNTGDRPVQIGSHYHFFEVNKALDFDRAASFGMRLDIPAGTAVRFEPGQKEVALVGLRRAARIVRPQRPHRRRRHRSGRCATAAPARAPRRRLQGRVRSTMVSIARRDYAALYGPTVGDGVRLADTSLIAVVERIMPSMATNACTAAARPCATASGLLPA